MAQISCAHAQGVGFVGIHRSLKESLNSFPDGEQGAAVDKTENVAHTVLLSSFLFNTKHRCAHAQGVGYRLVLLLFNTKHRCAHAQGVGYRSVLH